MKKLIKHPAQPSIRRRLWFQRETRDHFARQVNSLAALPPPVQAALQEILLPEDPVRVMIYAPYQGLLARRNSRRSLLDFSLPWEFTPDWVLVLTSGRLLLASITDPGCLPVVSVIPLENILYLKSGAILLFAWLEVHWVEQGFVRQETIYFSSVCERIFENLSRTIRLDLKDQTRQAGGPSGRGLEALEGLPYKFKNLIPLRLLLPDEPVCQVIFRPVVEARYLRVLRRRTAPRMALVLAGSHLLIAEENLAEAEGSYGLICTYLPLSRVHGLTCAPEGIFLRLIILLKWGSAGVEIPVLFQPPAQEEISLLISTFENDKLKSFP